MIAAASTGVAVLFGAGGLLRSVARKDEPAEQAPLAAKQTAQPAVRQPIDGPGADAREGATGPTTGLTVRRGRLRQARRTGRASKLTMELPPSRPVFEKPSETVENRAVARQAGNAVIRPFGRQAGRRRRRRPRRRSVSPCRMRPRREDRGGACPRLCPPVARGRRPRRPGWPTRFCKRPRRRRSRTSGTCCSPRDALAGEAGDAALVLQAIEMTGEFDIDVAAEKGRAMLALADKLDGPEQIGAYFNAFASGDCRRVVGRPPTNWLPNSRVAVYRACQRSADLRKKALDQRDRVLADCRRQAERRGNRGEVEGQSRRRRCASGPRALLLS